MSTNQHSSSIRQAKPSRWHTLLFLVLLPVALYPSLINPHQILSGHGHFSAHQSFESTPDLTIVNPLHSDPALLLFPLQESVRTAIHSQQLPLWNPDIYGGTPLLADGQSKVLAPSTWLSLIFSKATAAELEQWFILFVLASGFYRLCRHHQLGHFSAYVAAATALTMPFFAIWLAHPIALAACWLPWLLLGIQKKQFTQVALTTFAILIAGHPGTSIHIFLLASMCYLWYPSRKSLLGLLMGVGLSALIWLPQLAFVFESESLWSRGSNHLHLISLIDVLWPQALGHPSTHNFTGPDEWASSQLHVGLPCLFLTLLSLTHPGTRRQASGLLLAIGFCLILAVVGLPGPVNHTRLAGLALLGFSVTAAIGAQHMTHPLAKSVLFAGILVLGHWSNRPHQGIIPQDRFEPRIADWVTQLADDLECIPHSNNCGRFLGIDAMLIPNTGSLAGLRELRGYDLPVSQQTRRLMAALHHPPQSPWFPISSPPPTPLLLFANVRALVYSPTDIQWLEQQSHRAWFTQCTQKAQSPEAALQAITQTDLRGCPPIEGLEERPSASKNTVPISLIEHSPEHLILDISTVEDGVVVISSSYDSGWQATIDGHESPIYRAGGFAQAVPIPENARELVLNYRPHSWLWGLWLSFLSLCGLIGVELWRHRLRKNTSAQKHTG